MRNNSKFQGRFIAADEMICTGIIKPQEVFLMRTSRSNSATNVVLHMILS
jgi:hypothetical protein